MSVTQGIFRSRWGYHPCDWNAWIRIKRLRFLWFLTVRRLAAWRRWNNKLPHNRVIWRRIRGDDSRPVAWEKIGALAEPRVAEFMVREEWGRRQMAHSWIEESYRQAKRPAIEPAAPWPAARLKEIDELLDRLEAWYSGEAGV
jgi:hypothetical protein